MSRRLDLLEAAADALGEQRDPFHESFLIEHDEGQDLSVQVGTTAPAPDPKRRRPLAMRSARGDGRARSTGRTFHEVVGQPNPYWNAAQNQAAEENQ
ncbi:MAG: hypothetical protein AAF531_10420 [Actinomycetota bacterium]